MTDENIAAIRARLKFDSIEDFIEGYSRYISSGGIFIPMAANRLKPRGTTIRFQFLLGDGSTALLGEGKVHQVHEPNADNPSTPVGLLVKFTKLSQSSKRIVDQIVEAKSQASAADQEEVEAHEPDEHRPDAHQESTHEPTHEPDAATPPEEDPTAPEQEEDRAPEEDMSELAARALLGDDAPEEEEETPSAPDAGDDDLFARPEESEEAADAADAIGESLFDSPDQRDRLFEPPPLQTSNTPDPLPSAILPTHDTPEPSSSFEPIAPDVHSEPTVAHDLSEDSSPSRTPTIEAPVDPFSDFIPPADQGSSDEIPADEPLLPDEPSALDEPSAPVAEEHAPIIEEPERPEATLAPFTVQEIEPEATEDKQEFSLAPEISQPQNPFNTAINPFARLSKKEDEFDLGFDDPSEAKQDKPFDLGLDESGQIPGAPLNPFASNSASAGVSQNPFLTARARLKSIKTEEPEALVEESAVDLSDFEDAPLADAAEQRDDLFLSSFGKPAQQAPQPTPDVTPAPQDEAEEPAPANDFRDFLSHPPASAAHSAPVSDELDDFFAESSAAEDSQAPGPLSTHERLRGELFPDEDGEQDEATNASADVASPLDLSADEPPSLTDELFSEPEPELPEQVEEPEIHQEEDAAEDEPLDDMFAGSADALEEPLEPAAREDGLGLGDQLFDDSDVAAEGDASLDDELFFSPSEDDGEVEGDDDLDLGLDLGFDDDLSGADDAPQLDALQDPSPEEEEEEATAEPVPAPNPFANPLSSISPPTKREDDEKDLDAGAPPSSFQTSKPLPPIGPRTLAKTEGGLQILAYDDSTIMEESEGLDALSIADDEADIDMMFDGIFGGSSSGGDGGGLFGGGGGGGLFDAPASKPATTSDEEDDELLLEDDADEEPTAHSPSAIEQLDADEAPSQELASLLDQLNDDDDAPLHPSVDELHLSGPSIAEEEPEAPHPAHVEEDESLDALLRHAQEDIEAQKEATAVKSSDDILDDLLGEDASIQPGADASVEGNFMPMPEPNKKEKPKGFFSKLFGRDD